MAPTDRYSRFSVLLHWAMALGILAQITLGWWMLGIPKSPPGLRAGWFNIHKSIGITLGVLAIVRLAWRFLHPAPALPRYLPLWQRRAAIASHTGLYICMLVMPLAGYLGSSFTKYPIKYWGMTLPYWGWDAPALKEVFSAAHYAAAWVFMPLVAVHVLAALMHWFVKRDSIIHRMAWWNWS